jgi:hypothetical protein
MGYGKRDLARISLGMCLGCGVYVEKRRRCAPCAAKVAAQARKRYRKTAPRKPRQSIVATQKRERAAIAAGRLAYVTVKSREG